jgi:hypothetical protein
MEALQASALPLGYATINKAMLYIKTELQVKGIFCLFKQIES